MRCANKNREISISILSILPSCFVKVSCVEWVAKCINEGLTAGGGGAVGGDQGDSAICVYQLAPCQSQALAVSERLEYKDAISF